MTCPDCDREISGDKCQCGYRVKVYQFQAGVPVMPNGITCEQFGLSLYEAIFCCGGILQLRDMQKSELARADKAIRDGYRQRESVLHGQLAALTPKLPVADQEALIQRYPQLFS